MCNYWFIERSTYRTIANEEPKVTFVAVRPGRVDTPVCPSLRACSYKRPMFASQMQAVLRADGANSMSESSYQEFVQAHADGKLIKPEDPGHVIASLALNAPKDLSGQFVSWETDVCKPYRKE